MKFVTGYIFRSICMLMIGLLLVLNPNTPAIIIQVIAALFVLAGVVAIFHYLIMRFSKDSIIRPMFPITGIGSVCLGVLLGLYPHSFVAFLMYLLGALMLLIGISQFYTIIAQRAIAPVRWWLFLVPLLIVGCGVLVIAYPLQSASLPFVILGACCIVHGISELFFGLRLAIYQRKQARENRTRYYAKNEIVDAEIVE